MAGLSSLLGFFTNLLQPTTVTGTSAADLLRGTFGSNTIYGLSGNDKLVGGFGSDWLYGGSGSDKIYGGFGKDWIYGDGPPELTRVGVNFNQSASFATLSADKQTLTADGLVVEGINGNLANYAGLSIQAPLDYPTSGEWTQEIDAYNSNNVNAPEGVRLKFEVAQSEVVIDLAKFHIETIFTTPEPEKATVKVFLTDGTSQTLTIAATATGGNGDYKLQLKSADFGGKAIAAVELTPDMSPPSNVPASQAQSWVATHSFSEFTVAGVSSVTDLNNGTASNDKLFGGFGNDTIYGGRGNDTLSGGFGDDLLVGGSGNNVLCGGQGKDSFGFGFDATGKDVVKDFQLCVDKLKFYDGVTVTGVASGGGDTILKLSTGGTVTLLGISKVSDWHTLL